MGNIENRVKDGIKEITGALVGREMLEKLKAVLITQKPYAKMFGEKGERIFVNEDFATNETILPAWEFQWDTEVVTGGDWFHDGVLLSRILFPNNLSGKYEFFRLVAISISRFFNSQHFVNVFMKDVNGLNEFAENISFAYNLTYKRGEMSVPALVMRIPYRFDLRRYKILEECTDWDGELHSRLLKQIDAYFVGITDDKGNVLIPATEPIIKN